MDVSVTDTVVAIKSPFQLFSAFTEKDKDKFFGREKETKLLYQRVQEANVVLVYGESGTGKTSIVQCGLLNETKHFNWTSITIRRIDDMNDSLLLQLNNAIKDETLKSKQLSITESMQEVFLRNFQPVLLVFDQFEEIFVYGNERERLTLLEHIRRISAMSIPWKMVFVIREDFLAQLDEFEKKIPGLFKKRLRIELMNKSNCREVIVKSCEKFGISLMPLRKNENGQMDMVYNEAAPDTPDTIINTVCDSRSVIHLPYFQVFLDKLWKEAWALDHALIKINEALVQKVGNMGDVLKAFLEQKVNAQTIISPVDAWKFLKLFVPEKGTTRKKVNLKEFSAIPEKTLDGIVEYFEEYKILSGCAVNSYELAHESLVPIIQRIRLNEIRPRLTEPTITGNPYKGLASFNESDSYRFYGRKEAVNTVYEKVKVERLDFVAIVGNSGTGKSSLIKAGLFPLLINDGYKILPVVKAGDSPLTALNNSYLEAQQDNGHKEFILLIDQYEELNTRISQNQTREDVYNWIAKLLEKQKTDRSGLIVKIIVTIRADFEPQFSVKPQLAEYWKQGKYIIPPFTREEIREVIEEPAYQAGLEFSPPSLVEKIADEVYSSQSTGLLPLMSFTLKELYNKYINRGTNDNLLLEEDYTELGGVIGGLQNRAQHIYDRFEKDHPGNFRKYQTVMQHVILRMIYLSTGEIAGQRVLKENFIYKDDEINSIKDEILKSLIDSDLIVARKNNKEQEYYEPAHDVFIRSWGQIWDWINTAGKDKLSLRSKLTQAVEEYGANGQKPELLWDNKLTDGLLLEMKSGNTWLNKKEYDFVAASIKKRDEALANAEKEREEKYNLLQEKLAEENAKNKLISEKVTEQKNTIKRIRKFRAVILVALVFAALLGILAFSQYRLANKNYKNTLNQKTEIQTLNNNLQEQNKSLNTAKDSINTLAESTKQLLFLEQRASERASDAADAADRARAKALRLVAALNKEIGIREMAERLAKSRGDSLREVADVETKARFLTDAANKALVLKNRELDSTNNALRIQKSQNTSQLLTISKKLEEEDMVKAYLLAELAYKRDSSNKEAADRFRQISEKPAYYYAKGLEGDYSVFSPDGKKILLYSSLSRTVSLLESDTYRLISALTINPGLESVSFSHDGKYLLLVYKNEVEKRRVNNLNDKNNKDIKEKNIYNASMYGDRVLIHAEDGLHVWQKFLSEEIFTEGSSFKPAEKIISAFFSDDGKRVICNCEKGTVYIWSMESKPKKPAVKDVKLTAVSPAGNYFLSGSDTDLSIYNSLGNRIDIPGFKKYGQLNAAVFSEDGQHVLLSFTNSLNPLKSGPRQKGDFPYTETGYILLGLGNAKKDTINVSKLIKDDDVLISNNSISNVIIDGGHIIFKKPTGLVKLLRISNRQQEVLAGNSKPVKAISVGDDGSQILTSSIDNATKIWKYSTPGSLAAMKLLPELTAADLKKYGVD